MSHGRWIPLPVAMFLVVVCAQARGEVAATQPATVPESFIRFVDDQHGGGALQTADVAFKNDNGVVVHLIAAVHIGEKSYYEGLNKDFKKYDAVLYELVKPKSMVVLPPPGTPEPAGQSNPIGDFQRFLKNALELDFQLDDVDYTAKNFVHADLDKETFERMQEERGETFEQLMFKQMMNAFTNPPPESADSDDDSVGDLVKMLTRPDMERQIKVVLARQLGQMDTTAMGLDGPGGSVIITERNKAAFKVLDETIASGKKKLAIFYGGAHMPDMTKRLEAMGFSPVSVNWNRAWDLTIRADQPSAVEKLIDSIFNSTDDDKNN